MRDLSAAKILYKDSTIFKIWESLCEIYFFYNKVRFSVHQCTSRNERVCVIS